MTREEAQEHAKHMTYEDAVYNALQGRAIPYRKATLIKLHELLKVAKKIDKDRERMANDRLNKTISDVAYILDSLRVLRNIYETGDCNICAKRKGCEYVPKPGQMVRYNCPFYKVESEEYEE